MDMRGSYAIFSDDPEPIVVSVQGPPPQHVVFYNNRRKSNEDLSISDGQFSFTAEQVGDYSICISNGDEEHNDGESRQVAFNFRAIGNGFKNYTYPGLETELNELKQGISDIVVILSQFYLFSLAFEIFKDHQSYMNQREDIHKNTLESINNKVLFWTILESVILVALAYLQIRYISQFFETKRKL